VQPALKAKSIVQYGTALIVKVIHRSIFIARQHTDIAILSVRPSVRHIPVFYRNSLTYRHSFFTAPITTSFYFYKYQTSSGNSDWGHSLWGGKYKRV